MIYYIAHIKFFLFAILLFGTTAEIFAAEGDLDLSFDADGVVLTDNIAFGSESIVDLVVQQDGKIIAAGYTSEQTSSSRQTVVVRYNADGSIDSTFGASGKLIFQSVFPQELALQANGKIVFLGTIGTFPTGDFYVARINSDGSLDAGFNGTGSVTLDLRGTYDGARSVKVQADGKIVVGGNSQRSASSASSIDYALVRFNPDGSLDSTFDGDGKVFTSISTAGGESFSNLVIQPDGKIVAAGGSVFYDSTGFPLNQYFLVVRYNANGSLDTTFGGSGNGTALTPFGLLNGEARSIALQCDGKIVVAGTIRSQGSSILRAAVVRYNIDGTFDSSFIGGGRSYPSYDSFSVNDVTIQADNKIVIVGSAGNVKQTRAAIARLNADGSFDETFSGDGRNVIVSPIGISSQANTVAIQPNGKILSGGYISKSSSTGSDSLLARFDASSGPANCSGARRAVVADFDGDGKSDVSVFRPSNGYWYISKSSGGYSFLQWGISDDAIVPGDYDGDGKTDLAVYRRGANNTYYILRSSDNTFTARQLGRTGFLGNDTAAPADYDGDGKTDLAVYTGSDAIGAPGDFIIIQSSTNTQVTRQWGLNTDRRVVADYDGDGKDDLAVYRYRTFTGNAEFGTWYIQQSTNGATRVEYFGLSTDSLVPGDYDGDGKADIAVWRPSSGYWYWISSRDKSFNSYQFGLPDDKPTPADYDGDGKTDFAVFRPSNGVWYLQQSTRGFRAEQFGLSTDIPIPNVFVH